MKLDSVKQFVHLRAQLLREKAQLEQRLQAINQALADHTPASAPTAEPAPAQAAPPAAAAGKRRRRPQNPMTLREAVLQALKDKPLTKLEILQAVERLGYKFAAKNPRQSLDNLLYTKGLFRRVGDKFAAP
jgi:hypothetical protein